MFKYVLAVGLMAVSLASNAEIKFSCNNTSQLKEDVAAYFNKEGIDQNLIIATYSDTELEYRMSPNVDMGSTRLIRYMPVFDAGPTIVELPTYDPEKTESVNVSSKKEIIYAMMHEGRSTTFSGEFCSVKALEDHVGIRQNIVAWGHKLQWDFPDGEPAQWNTKFWNKGTPLASVSLVDALADAFKAQSKYSIGCYTAAKLVMAQGVVDYYARVAKNETALKKVLAALEKEGDPLIGIEPGVMWAFDKDTPEEELTRPGSILTIVDEVKAHNLIPGDWTYLLNSDTSSNTKPGYEGSNAIYLGGDFFDDFYNDHNYAYTYRQKLHEVYQWRNHVFSRTRDAHKVVPITTQYINEVLSLTPDKGGLVMPYRVVPRLFSN